MRFSDMKAAVKTAQVEWLGEAVDFAYHPAEFTANRAAEVSDLADAGNVRAVAGLVSPLLEWWDVLDDEGERMPTDTETVGNMPLAFVMAIVGAMGKDMRPPESRG
jgi:hypothetical protein